MKKWIIGGALLLAVVAAASAWAAIPGPNGVINGCYGKFGGVLRVIDEGKSCTSFEKPLAWNVQGPPGISGYEIVFTTNTRTSAFSSAFGIEATCPAGKRAVGGGGSANIAVPGSPFFAPLRILETGPAADGDGWEVSFGMPDGSFFPDDGRRINLAANAVCVNVAS